MDKPAINQYPIHELLKNRWSSRAFSNRPVALDELLSLFEAARWAPSGGNSQPWAFIFITQEDVERHQAFVDLLTGRNPDWAKNAPVLVLAVVNRERAPGKPNYWALYDLGQAVAHLTVQATAQGLSLRQMGGFDREKARTVFGVPEGYDPVTAIAIGYRGDPGELPEDMRAGELGGRSRKSLDEFVFAGLWNEPVQTEQAAPNLPTAS